MSVIAILLSSFENEISQFLFSRVVQLGIQMAEGSER